MTPELLSFHCHLFTARLHFKVLMLHFVDNLKWNDFLKLNYILEI